MSDSSNTGASERALEWELQSSQSDGISALRFWQDSLLLVSSWDSSVALYEITEGKQKLSYRHRAAVLDVCFSDKFRAFSGGLDRSLKMYEFASGAETILGTHTDAIKCVSFSAQKGLLFSASWDKTLKVWDNRASTPLQSSHDLPGKAYSMDLVQDRLVVATSDRHIHIYDVRKLDEPVQRRISSLKYQTRCLRCFPNGTGYAVSSVEGRIAMEYFDPAPDVQKKTYAFKCHRQTIDGVDTVYPVNALAFHPGYGTFASGGCDGTVSVWDGENKKKLRNWSHYPTSISSLAFNASGNVLAVAASYTWEEGEREHPKDSIFIRNIRDVDVKPKPRK